MDLTKPLQSYMDPGYDKIEAAAEKRRGVPPGTLASIRTKGERSNADQVSSAGARTVYQIIPSTRAAFLKRDGIDAYASPEKAADVAAMHLAESAARNGGDWNAAVAEYHGGTNRANWGPKTRRYVQRAGAGPLPAEPATDSSVYDKVTADEFYDRGYGLDKDAGRGRLPRQPRSDTQDKLAAVIASGGIPAPRQDIPPSITAATTRSRRSIE